MQACLDCKLNNCVLVYLRHLRKKTVSISPLGTNHPWGPGVYAFCFTERDAFVSRFTDLVLRLLRSLLICFTDPWGCEDSMALNHTALPQDERLPHYLRDEDPFASKLSWEADLVAGFYLTIIGKLP